MNTAPSSSGLGQVAIVVTDLARARRFYETGLGLRHLFDAGPSLTFLAAGDVRLMLTTHQAENVARHGAILYFRAASVDATYARLLDFGGRSASPPKPVARLSGHELWIAEVYDPDSAVVGVMEERA